MIDIEKEAKAIARDTAMSDFEGTCYRAIVALCRRVAAETWDEAAKLTCWFCAQGVLAQFENDAWRHHLPQGETPWVVCQAMRSAAAKSRRAGDG